MVEGKAVLKAGEWNSYLRSLNRRVSESFRMLKVAFNTAGFADIMSHFRNESSPSGRWKPIKRKGKILQDTGFLRNSILPSNAKKINKNTVLLFANASYGGKHDRGIGVKKREFMWLSESAKERMSKIILDLFSRG